MTTDRIYDAAPTPGTSESGNACLVGRCECCGCEGVICTTQDGEILTEAGTLAYVADGRTILTRDSLGRGWTICDDCDQEVRS